MKDGKELANLGYASGDDCMRLVGEGKGGFRVIAVSKLPT